MDFSNVGSICFTDDCHKQMLVGEATSFAYEIITLSKHGSFPLVVVGIIVIAKEQV